MEQWYCFKCKEKMVEEDIWMAYLEIVRTVPGLKCPKCNAAYLTEETAVEVVGKGEDDIDLKMA